MREVVARWRGEQAVDGGGVRMTRIIGSRRLDHLDPFLLLDEFRSDNPRDYVAGFPDHPHRGFSTLTYMLAGEIAHGDNRGNSGLVGPGGIQWMTAGRGIVHHEYPRQSDGLLWGFQFWLNLPAQEKMCAPDYADIPAAGIPEAPLGDSAVARVLAGEFLGQRGPVNHPVTQPLLVDLRGAYQGRFGLDRDLMASLYVYQGAVTVGEHTLERGDLAELGSGDEVEISMETGSGCLLVCGRPLDEPLARYGPFVMNTQQQIVQAVEDFRAGRL